MIHKIYCLHNNDHRICFPWTTVSSRVIKKVKLPKITSQFLSLFIAMKRLQKIYGLQSD